MLLSMTGYGSARGEDTAWIYAVDSRSYNHRHCEIRVRLPSEWAGLTPELEGIIRRHVHRGRVEVGVEIEPVPGTVPGPRVDVDRARALKTAYETLARDLGLPSEITLGMLVSLPGVIVSPEVRADPARGRDVLLRTVDLAVRAMAEMREREGSGIEADLRSRVSCVRATTGRIRDMLLDVAATRRSVLESRMRDLLGPEGLDAARVAQEAAILADRSDVTEELQRLESHCAQFTELLGGNEPIGRKLDFLLQEMSREANTIGAKAMHAPASHLVVELKAEIERMREQVQNVE